MKIPKPLLDGIKEALRVCLIAVVPLLIDGLQKGALDLRLVGVVAAVAVLRLLDKWLHEWGKENRNELALKGLTRF